MKSTLHDLYPHIKGDEHGPLLEDAYFNKHPRLVCTNPQALPIDNSFNKLTHFSHGSWAKVPTPLPFHQFTLEFNSATHSRVFLIVDSEEHGHKTLVRMFMECQFPEKPLPTSRHYETAGYVQIVGTVLATEDFRWKVLTVGRDNEVGVFELLGLTSFQAVDLRTQAESTFVASVAYLMSFIQVMNSSNTELVTNKPGKVSVHMARKKKLAIPRDYLTVRVKPSTKKAFKPSQGGTHSSPVAHARRSHLRVLQSGVSIVIPPMMVNAHKGAATLQEYIF